MNLPPHDGSRTREDHAEVRPGLPDQTELERLRGRGSRPADAAAGDLRAPGGEQGEEQDTEGGHPSLQAGAAD